MQIMRGGPCGGHHTLDQVGGSGLCYGCIVSPGGRIQGEKERVQ